MLERKIWNTPKEKTICYNGSSDIPCFEEINIKYISLDLEQIKKDFKILEEVVKKEQAEKEVRELEQKAIYLMNQTLGFIWKNKLISIDWNYINSDNIGNYIELNWHIIGKNILIKTKLTLKDKKKMQEYMDSLKKIIFSKININPRLKIFSVWVYNLLATILYYNK